jgi:uncharacterized protein YoaH (UPF0181 family)
MGRNFCLSRAHLNDKVFRTCGEQIESLLGDGVSRGKSRDGACCTCGEQIESLLSDGVSRGKSRDGEDLEHIGSF